jgi:hypothetical protein
MRALLVFLVFAGAGAYGFLAALHNLLPPVNPEVAAVDQSRRAPSGSWGSYLPEPSDHKQSVQSNWMEDWAGPAITGGRTTLHKEPELANEEPVQADMPANQPPVATAPARSTATEVAVQTPLPKATPKRKASARLARPAPAPTDAAMQATHDPYAAKRQRRPFGFLFGRYAARE